MLSTTPTLKLALRARMPLHIIDTKAINSHDVLVSFSDGSAAVYDIEELEKLRPTPKQMFSMHAQTDATRHPLPADSGPLAA